MPNTPVPPGYVPAINNRLDLERFALAYDAYQGQDLPAFIESWKQYFTGTSDKIPDCFEADNGVHHFSSGLYGMNCDYCGESLEAVDRGWQTI